MSRLLSFSANLLIGAFALLVFVAGITFAAADDDTEAKFDAFLDDVMEYSEESDSYRNMNASYNNLLHPDWGNSNTPLFRSMPSKYADGIGAPEGGDRPGPREISNAIADQGDLIPEPRGLSDMIWQWGQFLDHDITLVGESEDGGEIMPIAIPKGDPYFDPQGKGNVLLNFHRSVFDLTDGGGVSRSREQMNSLTAYIDGSNIYGSDDTRAAALREFSGGRLKTSGDDLLPKNTAGLPNGGGTGAYLFLAGDVRANEQIALTAMHTLWVREHNHWADLLSERYPDLSDEAIYQSARKIVIAELQSITFNEFLPALFGRQLPLYRGYKMTVPAMIDNIFATAAFRFGHSTISPFLQRVDNWGNDAPGGKVALRDAFFVRESISDSNEIGYLLKGLASQTMQRIDNKVIDDLRNFLFGAPGSGGLDLVSLNIQRGRDHGLPTYNEIREHFGIGRVTRFDQITKDKKIRRALRNTYGDVDKIDAWVGMLAEDHAAGASIGKTMLVVLEEQFLRLRDGDRFWYENIFSDHTIRFIEGQTLAEIIKRNTQISNLQDNVFFAERTTYEPGDETLCSIGFSPAVISAGEGTTLWWWTDGVTGGSFDHDIGEVTDFPEGDIWFYPAASGTYTFHVWGPQGEARCEANIEVEGSTDEGENPDDPDNDDETPSGDAPLCAVGFSPSTIGKGEGTALWWWSEGAKGGSIDNGIGEVELPASDTWFHPKTSGTYTMTLWNDFGETTCSAEVTVEENSTLPKPLCAVGFSPAVIDAGESTTLWWWSEYGETGSIDQGIGTISLPENDIYFAPEESGTYTFTVEGSGGTTTCTADVTVQ